MKKKAPFINLIAFYFLYAALAGCSAQKEQWDELSDSCTETSDTYRNVVSAKIVKGEIVYLAPMENPFAGNNLKTSRYLKAHRAGWEDVILNANIDGNLPLHGGSTCCEATQSVTVGWYRGQDDANSLIDAIESLAKQQPNLIKAFRELREHIRKKPTTGWYIPDM